MDRENNNIGCLEIEIFPINSPLDLSCFPLTDEVEISCFALTEPLQLSCFEICSVNKEGRFWLWDAGEKILWDNNIEIDY